MHVILCSAGNFNFNFIIHSLLRDNPQIPTNPLSGSQQPSLLWGQILLEINAGIPAMLDSN